jgi:hypothetical protein
MVTVSVKIRAGAVTCQVRVAAASIRRALEVAGEGRPGAGVEVVLPMAPDAYFGADTGWMAELQQERTGI